MPLIDPADLDQVKPLVVGDRVQRRDVLIARITLIRQGTVVEVYQSRPNAVGHTLPLYAVEWEGQGFIERGYFREGLVKITPDVA
jgi:hypothetical protein